MENPRQRTRGPRQRVGYVYTPLRLDDHSRAVYSEIHEAKRQSPQRGSGNALLRGSQSRGITCERAAHRQRTAATAAAGELKPSKRPARAIPASKIQTTIRNTQLRSVFSARRSCKRSMKTSINPDTQQLAWLSCAYADNHRVRSDHRRTAQLAQRQTKVLSRRFRCRRFSGSRPLLPIAVYELEQACAVGALVAVEQRVTPSSPPRSRQPRMGCRLVRAR